MNAASETAARSGVGRPVPQAVPSIWQELERWSQGFANWQKLLLASAVRNGSIPSAAIDQAYAVFLAEHQLAPAPDPAPDIPASITGREHVGSVRRLLKRVYAPSGVNRLPHTSEISFASGLTVIYGANGVGKSGFARIMSNACFSRQQHPIYPDVFDANAPSLPTAMIDLIADDGTITGLSFDTTSEHSELKRGFAVFDSSVANLHLTDTGPFGFTPTGFDVFGEMARAYSVLQTKLAADIQRRRRENPLTNAFIGAQTPASVVGTALGQSTNLEQLRSLATFGPDQAARIEQLQSQADQLRVRSPETEIKRLSDARPQLISLKEQLVQARLLLSEEFLASDRRLRQALATAAIEFSRASADQFQHEKIQSVGSADWEEMIAASQAFVSQQHEHYPSDGDVCLLCQQPLGEDARQLYARYLAFTSGETRAALIETQRKVEERRREIERISIRSSEEGSLAHSFLSQSNPAVLSAIIEGVTEIKRLQSSVLAALAGEGNDVIAAAIPDFGPTLDAVIQTIDGDLLRLRQSDVPTTLVALERERVELRHREVLSQNLDAAVSYVNDQKWIARADGAPRAALNPRHLTEKQSELFTSVIAKNYRENLATECEALACNVPVELRTQGRQGKTVRSLSVKDRSPDDILSEGEQRAVALADFLTEVGLNDDNVGIILDDPVTSLDHDRKERIAARLVTAASQRQVIIFTHDMVFFAKLGDAADKAGAEITTHWMQRSGDNVPGLVSANDAPTTTPQYRKTDFAEATLAMAKAAAGSEQEKLVRQGAGQLRRTVEEIVPQFLFKEVVRRWTDRVMVTALKKISWDNSLADEIVEIFEACSAIMEGHSHTEAGAEAPPTPAKLEELVVKTKELIRRAKQQRG
jgi:energy-coupling factor transporter ATP-binding protein EcfA2